MIKHLFKLVWNRRRVNALLTVEILISFLVLSAVVTMLVHLGGVYGEPLGFRYANLLYVSLDKKVNTNDTWQAEEVETTRQLLREARQMGGVEAAGAALYGPFAFGSSAGLLDVNGRQIRALRDEVTDEMKDVLGLEIVQGRWFGPEDNGQNWLPLVLTQQLSEALFGQDNPIGQNIAPEWASHEWRVVGVVAHYRPDGRFSAPPMFYFQRADLSNPELRPPSKLILKMRSGVTAEAEQALLARLQVLARTWSFEIDRMTDMRKTREQAQLIPVLLLGTVVAFLLMMVALGLAGVLWQNVTARMGEIGLRRAVGGSATDIRRQILGELAVMTTLSLLLGTVLFLQAPLLGLFALPFKTYLLGLLASIGAIYTFVTLCGLYPSHLATRVHPSEALHYE